MKKTLFVSLLLVTFVLSACETGPEENKPEIEASTVDKQVYEDAINSMNQELCNTINSGTLKDDCALVISSNELVEKAMKELNLSICDQIKHPQIAESCKIQIEKINAEKEQKEKELALQNVEKSQMQSIQDEMDLNACEKLQTPHLKKECVINVSTALADAKKDSSYCDAIESEALRAKCKQASE